MTASRLAMELAPPAPPPPGMGPEPHQSFERLYETHFSFVWRSARRLGTPLSNLDDVVQEIFVVVHRRLGAFEGRSSIKTWLFGILADVVRAHRPALRLKHPQTIQRHVRSDSG